MLMQLFRIGTEMETVESLLRRPLILAWTSLPAVSTGYLTRGQGYISTAGQSSSQIDTLLREQLVTWTVKRWRRDKE